MAAYSYGQLETLWINAGGPKAVAPLMAAIALAESGGNPGALNQTDNNGTQTSVGLWQVSSGTHQYPSAWATAQGNATEAVAKYKSQGLGAWGTYTSGAYLQYYKGGTPASSLPQGGGTQQATLDSAPGWLVPVEAASGPIGILNAIGTQLVGGISGGVGTAHRLRASGNRWTPSPRKLMRYSRGSSGYSSLPTGSGLARSCPG